MSGEAILSAENSGKPLGGRGSAPNSAGGTHSAPQTPYFGGEGLLPPRHQLGGPEELTALPWTPWLVGGGCCPLSKNPRSRPPASIIGPSVSAPNDKSWTRRWRQYLVNGARRTIKGEVWTIRILQ